MAALDYLSPGATFIKANGKVRGAAMGLHLKRVLGMVNKTWYSVSGTKYKKQMRFCLRSISRRKCKFRSEKFCAIVLIISHNFVFSSFA